MFAYSLPGGLPAGSRTVWSRLPLQPITSTVLTPFSYSLFEEVAGRAWFQYYDTLGFEPTPRTPILRQFAGRAYLNLTASAQREAEFAGIEPPILQINGAPLPICTWEKPGLLAGFRTTRQRKKHEDLMAGLIREIGGTVQKAETWWRKTQELRWTQADILQIMEEIERAAIAVFIPYWVARYNLELIYNRLLWLINDKNDQEAYSRNLTLIANAIGDYAGSVEHDITEAVCALGALAATDPMTVTWLGQGEFSAWQQQLPSAKLRMHIEAFLHAYGHRSVNEGEINLPRWNEDPSLLFTAVRLYAQKPRMDTDKAATALAALLALIEPAQRKQAEQWILQARQLMQLQSKALHGLAYILAGTRSWVKAASRETVADQRLQAPDDIFFFALEEIKQMMTGEWNISARSEIQATCRQRRAEFVRWQQMSPAELLIGETEAVAVVSGFAAVSTELLGPL